MESLSKDDNVLSSFPNVILWQLSYPWSLFRLSIVCAYLRKLLKQPVGTFFQFGASFTTITSTFHISMTPKVHIVLHHIPQFIGMTQMPLGLFSEEVVEEQHKRLKFYKRYGVNCTYNRNFPNRFLNSVIHYNSYHI